MNDAEILTREPNLIDLCRSGDADERTIMATINRAAMILGGGDSHLMWTAIGNGTEPSDARKVEWARELLDAALFAERELQYRNGRNPL